MQEAGSGLEGVVVADTRLSDVDGEAGRLVIAGSRVEALAASVPFEEVVRRLLGDEAGEGDLGAARLRAWPRVARLVDALAMKDGMDALRACAATLDVAAPVDIIGAVSVFVAANARVRMKREPLPPNPAARHAPDTLRMMTGATPGDPSAKAIDAYFVTVVDHGMNASTFTARVIASTGSDPTSAVTGAIGALKGPLHGGAPGPVLDMLDAIGSAERAEEWMASELDAGRRIMGMGHRVYRVRDPRAAVLEREVQRLEAAGVASGRLALARAAERAAERALAVRHPERPLRANVEFYTAVLLEALGVPRESFSPVFAAARVAGWCAHVAEQKRVGRLIRPSSRYVGATPQA
jgi:citrate synthase